MPRVYEAPTELLQIDDNHLLLMGYKDASAEDKKGVPSKILNSFKHENLLINGCLDIWQREVSFAAIADGDYHADRFGYEKSGAMVHTVSRESSILPSGDNFNYAIKVDVTTVDAAIAAGDYCLPVEQVIEGYNLRKLINKYVTLGFWVRSPKTGIHCVSFRNSGKDRSYVSEYTISVADTWEYKTITILLDNTAGTWDYLNGAGLRIAFAHAVGSTFQTTKDTWQTGDFMGTSSQVNVCDNVANNFYITGITFNIGKIPIPCNSSNRRVEIEDCQGYLQKSYNIDTIPGTVTQTGAANKRQDATSTILIGFQKLFMTRMRDTPTTTWYSPGTGASGNVYNETGAADVVINTTTAPGETSSGLPVVIGAITAGDTISGHFVCDAEISL